MIQLQILDPTKETDPERKKEAIKRNMAVFQIQQIMDNHGFYLNVAWDILANVSRIYLYQIPESERVNWIEAFLAIVKEPILCTDCMMEEAEQATKQ
jgi:hypothetical protein